MPGFYIRFINSNQMKNLLFFFFLTASSHAQTTKNLIYKTDFSKPLDCKEWVAEMDNLPGHTSTVYTHNNALVLDTRGGVTVWLNKKLSGNIQIEYKRVVRMGSGCNDRLGDLNQFWMATDPKNANLFTRRGKFQEYDDLNLYYVGVGGHFNTFTRFRKYLTPTSKPVIKEYTDSTYLLEAEKVYHIKIIVKNGTSSFWLNGECYFNYADPAPLTSGYFGFRSLQSRQEIRDLRIYTID